MYSVVSFSPALAGARPPNSSEDKVRMVVRILASSKRAGPGACAAAAHDNTDAHDTRVVRKTAFRMAMSRLRVEFTRTHDRAVFRVPQSMPLFRWLDRQFHTHSSSVPHVPASPWR